MVNFMCQLADKKCPYIELRIIYGMSLRIFSDEISILIRKNKAG